MSERVLETALAQHQSRLIDYAFRRLGDRGTAEEIVQDAYVAAWRKGPEEPQHLKHWLYMVVGNRCTDRIRTREKQHQIKLAYSLDEWNDLPYEDRALDRLEEREILAAALARLDERHRTVLVLRGEGMRYDAIALVMGVTVNRVKGLIREARFMAQGLRLTGTAPKPHTGGRRRVG